MKKKNVAPIWCNIREKRHNLFGQSYCKCLKCDIVVGPLKLGSPFDEIESAHLIFT
jgi:hypothetical protein